MRIRTRLLLAFIGVLIPYLALASVGALGFQAVWKRIQSIQEEVVIKVRRAVDLEVAVLGLLQPPRDYLMFGDPSARDEFERRLADAQEVLARLGAVYVYHPEERRLLEAVRYQIREIEVVSREILVSPDPRRDPATIARMKTLVVLSEVAAAALRRFREVTELQLAEEIRGGRSVVRMVTAGGVAAVVLSVAGGVGLALVFARWIGRPFQAIAEGSRRMAEGDLSARVNEGGAAELGATVRAFNLMAERLEASFAALGARKREIETLHRSAQFFAGEPDPDRLLQRVVEAAAELVGARYGALGVFGEDGRICQFLTAGLTPEERERIARLPEGRGLLGHIFRGGETLRLDDLASHPDSVGFPPGHPPMRSLLGMPIRLGGKILGILYMTEKPGGFTAGDEGLLETLCRDAAVTIENARLHQEVVSRVKALEEARQRLEVLYDVVRRLVGAHDTGELLSVIVNEATRLLGVEAAGIRLLEGDDLVVRARTARAFDVRPRLKVGESLSGLIVSGGEPIVVEDLAQDTRYDAAHKRGALEHGFQSFLGVPLRLHDRTIGVLNVYARARRRFVPDEVSLLSAFADQASIAMEKSQLYRESVERVKVLEAALAQVKQLQGLLPICAWCKKVRKDENYWQSVESYVTEHTDARFSHGICPECKGKLVTRRDANG